MEGLYKRRTIELLLISVICQTPLFDQTPILKYRHANSNFNKILHVFDIFIPGQQYLLCQKKNYE